MDNINAKMDEQLKNRVDALNRTNDENQDGRLDAADLKAQLNRIEAQLDAGSTEVTLTRAEAVEVAQRQRALGDALTQAGILRDDALIVAWDAAKVYGQAPEVRLTAM